MASTVASAANLGFDNVIISVECDKSKGLPSITIVGLGNKAIDESKERIRAALSNSKLDLPRQRITLNLAPADMQKDGSSFDLPMALAILLESGQIPLTSLNKTLVIGELALDGSIRPIKGVLGHVQAAKTNGFNRVILPPDNYSQASLIKDIDLLSFESLRDIYNYFCGLTDKPKTMGFKSVDFSKQTSEFSQIVGQEHAKRALEVAAAGSHNILFTGPPGTGKTMLAKALHAILPDPVETEIVEITKLSSLSGENTSTIVQKRPFRSPHHTTSYIAMVGGGSNPKPGEISLSHRGVLFLDELPEFGRATLEALRQPLEDKQVRISRANRSVSYPADFMLIATQNPCPCGYYGDESKECVCTPNQIMQYNKKISGPLLDRIDIVVPVNRVEHRELLKNNKEYSDEPIRKRVLSARNVQKKRFGNLSKTNSNMTNRDIKKHVIMTDKAKDLLVRAGQSLNLSPRACIRTIKVAQTIVDLDNCEVVDVAHISEALQYRQRQET
ncbi:ATP-binding protein [Candidatus Saccharibacteria bacterium CPR2]|nr:ATP-binding protein [Candidatus Saccharibacteria bacterium CPR2]